MSDNVDWPALEEYFITKTPAGMSYRVFSDQWTEKLKETSFTWIEYNKLRDYGKGRHWIQKRAQFLIENSPGLYQDTEAIYSLLRDKIVYGDNMTAAEMASLSREIRELAVVLRSKDAIVGGRPDEGGGLTRDEVLTELEKIVRESSSALIDLAIGKASPGEDG